MASENGHISGHVTAFVVVPQPLELPGGVTAFCTSARRVRLTSLPHPSPHLVPLIFAETQGFNYQAGCSEAARC